MRAGLRPDSASQIHGFSLVEVALAIAILAVGMTGVLAVLPVGLDAARLVHQETVAAGVARSAISELQSSNQGRGNLVIFTNSLAYSSEGVRLNNTNDFKAIFLVSFQWVTNSPSSVRGYLTLRWPKTALDGNPNNTNVQTRYFLTEINRSP